MLAGAHTSRSSFTGRLLVGDIYWYGFRPSFWYQLTAILYLMIVLIPAAIGDYRHQKIPNVLTMSGWLVGPLAGYFFVGLTGVGDSLLGLLFMLGIMFPLWIIHWFGAADVKLLGSVGAMVGIGAAPQILLGVMLAGMLFAIIKLLYQRRMVSFLFRMRSGQLFSGGIKHPTQGGESEEAGGGHIPYAIPIGFGTLLTLLYINI